MPRPSSSSRNRMQSQSTAGMFACGEAAEAAGGGSMCSSSLLRAIDAIPTLGTSTVGGLEHQNEVMNGDRGSRNNRNKDNNNIRGGAFEASFAGGLDLSEFGDGGGGRGRVSTTSASAELLQAREAEKLRKVKDEQEELEMRELIRRKKENAVSTAAAAAATTAESQKDKSTRTPNDFFSSSSSSCLVNALVSDMHDRDTSIKDERTKLVPESKMNKKGKKNSSKLVHKKLRQQKHKK